MSLRSANSLLHGTTAIHRGSELVHPCTFLTGEFFAMQKTSLLLNTTDVLVRSECTSLYKPRHEFAISATDGGRVQQKRCSTKILLLWNSQGNLQHGRCKLTKTHCCMEPPPSMAVLTGCQWFSAESSLRFLQRFDRVEFTGLPCGIEPEENACPCGNQKRDQRTPHIKR